MKSFTTRPATTKQWLLTASTDGNMVNYEEIIESNEEPDFWTCYNIAQEHDCDFFNIEELENEVLNVRMFKLKLEKEIGHSGEYTLCDYLATCYDYGEEVPNDPATIASFIRENSGKDDGFVYALILMDEHEDGSFNNVIEYFVTDSTNTIKYWTMGE